MSELEQITAERKQMHARALAETDEPKRVAAWQLHNALRELEGHLTGALPHSGGGTMGTFQIEHTGGLRRAREALADIRAQQAGEPMSPVFGHHPAECSSPYVRERFEATAAEHMAHAEHMDDGVLRVSCDDCCDHLAEREDVGRETARGMIRAGRSSL